MKGAAPAPGTGGPNWLLPACGAVAGAAAAATRIRAYDFFWHLAAGRFIAGGGGIPRGDPFSFTAAGTPWVDHGWLYQVLLWGLWDAAGPAAVWAAKLLLAAGIGWLIAAHLERRGVAPAAIAAALVIVLRGASIRFMDRPEIVTLLLAAVAAALLLDERPRRAFWLIPLTALWANLHAGAVLAPLLAGGVVAGQLLDRARGRPGARWPAAAAAVLAGSGAALLVNPYGAKILAVPFQLAGIVGQPWAANPEWTRPGIATVPGLYAAAAGWLVAALLLHRRMDGPRLLLGLLAMGLGLRYVRNVGLFWVLLPFAAAPLLAAAGPAMRRIRPAAAAGLVAAGAVWMALAPAVGTPGPGLEPGRFPQRAADFLEREGAGGRWFCEVAFGGYLIWRFPDRPVFIDGRNEVHAALLQEIHEALEEPTRFWDFTRRWDLDVALLRYPPAPMRVQYRDAVGGTRTVPRSWSEVYFPRVEWALVHWDDTAMVRVRRSAFDPAWIERHEYRVLNPDDWDHVQDRILSGELKARDVREELRRQLADDPTGWRARALLGALDALPGPGGALE